MMSSNVRKRYSLNLQSAIVAKSMPASPNLERRVAHEAVVSPSSFHKLRSLDFPSSSRDSVVGDVDANSMSHCKLLLIGDSNVGKTATILSYCNELMTKGRLKKLSIMKHKNNSNPAVGNVAYSPSRAPSLKLVERKQRKLLGDRDQKKRYSLNDFEELSKRKSILFPSVSIQQHQLQPRVHISDALLSEDDEDNDDDNDDEIVIQTRSTIGVDIKTRLVNVDNQYFNCIFWDTAGQERFQNAIIPSLYKNCNGIILTYDICNFKSFENCFDHWLKEAIRNMSSKDLPKTRFFLVGNKIDLYKHRQVKHEDVLKRVFTTESKYGITIFGNFEVSCKWPQSVDTAFNTIILNLIQNSCYEDLSVNIPQPSLPLIMSDLAEELSSDDNLSIYSATSQREEDNNSATTLRHRNNKTIDILHPSSPSPPLAQPQPTSCCT